MSEHKFNHDAENVDEAVGVNAEELATRLRTAIDAVKPKSEEDEQNWASSRAIEAVSNEFNVVELAYLFDRSLSQNRMLNQQLGLATMLLKGGMGDEA